jgi:hypothetical protein
MGTSLSPLKSGKPLLLFLTSPINYSRGIFPCKILPDYYTETWQDSLAEDQLTEEIENTQTQQTLSRKDDVTAK